MKKRVLDYMEHMDRLLKTDNRDTDWDRILENHLTQIGFFQHERLAHLIVTVTFGILLVLMAVILLDAEEFTVFCGVLAIFVIVLVTLMFYIRHYFFLENNVQKMYGQYDEIMKKRRL